VNASLRTIISSPVTGYGAGYIVVNSVPHSISRQAGVPRKGLNVGFLSRFYAYDIAYEFLSDENHGQLK